MTVMQRKLALGLLLLISGWARADAELEQWRAKAGPIRMLAENDAPQAYREAQGLQAMIPADAEPIDKVRLWNLLARIEVYLADTENAASHIQQAMELATKNSDPVGQAEADLNNALNAINQAKIDDAIVAAIHGLAVLDGVNRPELLSEALLRTAMMYRRIDQIDESVTLTMQAMDIARQSNNPLALVYAHQGLAISYEYSGHYAEARDQYQLMLEQARLAGSKLQEGYALQGQGNCLRELGDLKSAEPRIRQAIENYRSVGTPFNINFGLFALAENLRKQGRTTESLPILDEIIAFYQHYPNKIGLWWALNARSVDRMALKDEAGARRDVEQAYVYAREIGSPVYLTNSAKRLAAIVAANGKHRQAYQLLFDADEMAAKLAKESASARMLQLTRRYQTESKQREIDKLNRLNQLQDAELMRQALEKRWLWTVLGGSLAVLLGSTYFLLRLRRANRLLETANTQLLYSQEEIRSLNTSLDQRVKDRTLALRQQTRYLRTLIDTLPFAVWLKDTQHRYLFANGIAATIAGHKSADMIGKDDFELGSSEIAAFNRDSDVEVMETRQIKNMEIATATEQGPVWMEIDKAPVLDEDGAVLGTVGVARNITARKLVERELVLLNRAMSQSANAIFLVDDRLRFVYVNDAACRSLGYSRDELLAMSPPDIDPDVNRETVLALMKLGAGTSGSIFESRHRAKDGHIFPVEVAGCTFELEGATFSLTSVRDISDRKAMDEAREAALAEAERLVQLRSNFLAQMSHELRTPLNGILGYAQILQRDKTMGERQLVGLNVILQSGEHLLTLINDILDFAKIDAGKIELNLTDIPLRNFLQTIAEIVRVRAELKPISFVCDFAPDLPQGIHADDKRLRQILLNLLSNAVKYTDYGQVILQVCYLPPACLRFAVHDSGIGIGADKLEDIFRPFEQVSDAAHQMGGTGLGLPISRQLVRMMGGELQVTSRVDEGSTFWFELELPVLHSVMPVLPGSGEMTGYQGPRKKILVVDDVAENRAVMIEMLGQIGFEMFEADNGHDGLEKAQTVRPDLILMDIVMPDMDGLEVTRRLRRIPGFEALPIIAVSASVSDNDEKNCLQAGVNMFLSKPVDMGRLMEKISAFLAIDWITAQPRPQIHQEADTLVAPPETEMDKLHELALQGDMRGILRIADRLIELDEYYRPFSDQLRQLAHGYQSKAMLSFVERHLIRKQVA